MSTNELKYKIKGNESFSIREGWLAKGLFALEENKYVFSEKTAMDKREDKGYRKHLSQTDFPKGNT